jgi:hypothetical protein
MKLIMRGHGANNLNIGRNGEESRVTYSKRFDGVQDFEGNEPRAESKHPK